VEEYREWKKGGRERRRKFLQRFVPWLRPAISEDQHGALRQADQHPEDSTPPRYPSEGSLLLKKEEAK
jgi:hypothetical protein